MARKHGPPKTSWQLNDGFNLNAHKLGYQNYNVLGTQNHNVLNTHDLEVWCDGIAWMKMIIGMMQH